MFALCKAVQSIKAKLEKLSLRDFDRENVSNVVSWICGATRFLKGYDSTLQDEIGVVVRALLTSSMAAYNQLVEKIYSNHHLGIKKKMVEYMLYHVVEDFNNNNNNQANRGSNTNNNGGPQGNLASLAFLGRAWEQEHP